MMPNDPCADAVLRAAPLPCPHCTDGWRLVEYNGYVVGEVCTECNGSATVACEEPGCIENAVREFVERGERYPLCQKHHQLWCSDAEVTP